MYRPFFSQWKIQKVRGLEGIPLMGEQVLTPPGSVSVSQGWLRLTQSLVGTEIDRHVDRPLMLDLSPSDGLSEVPIEDVLSYACLHVVGV